MYSDILDVNIKQSLHRGGELFMTIRQCVELSEISTYAAGDRRSR
jgi:hypothetical protein